GALREVVAAQMCGRWRNGVPYELSPDAQFPETEVSPTNFNYTHASRCPAGSHLRRANPRGGPIVQRIANYTRRLVRRGMSYGPDFDPKHPDDQERGLLGSFIGANIAAQFEAVMCDWINLGLHDPNITGANDPILGANTPETSWFDMTLPDGDTIRLHGLPRLIYTRGGAYTFLPSMAAIQYLSELRT
ncbi:MAG: peroxidase, partial [Pseudomonadota bacterium]